MKKCKIVVYAICKNEESFVSRWMNSMQEADEIYVLDTGSTDNTVEELQKRGAHVTSKHIHPWRFDVARNESLNLVPMDTDICVCTDLDELFEPGWRETLEKAWQSAPIKTRVRYQYHWKLNDQDIPQVSFILDKIHERQNYHWQYPVHEVLKSCQEEHFIIADITLKHYPDPTKSRSSYLPLLEISVKENPEDDRNLHYLGREYMYYQEYDKCIAMLHRHLHCKNARWKDERCASMRFIARSYWNKFYLEEAYDWYKRAIREAPYLRESYVELASLLEQQQDYQQAYTYLKKALKIKEKSQSYIVEEFAWNDYFYDLLSLAAFYTGHYKEAIKYVKKAMKQNKKEDRYLSNYQLMLPYLKSSSHE